MELTHNQNYMYELGKEAKELINNEDISLKNAIGILIELHGWEEKIDAVIRNKDKLFFEAGYDGFEPQWRSAIRYGEVPESGFSINHATGEYEKGVSCVGLLKNDMQDIASIYDITLGMQGIEKNIIEGWYLGNSGSDGEPLLLNCIKM